MRLKVQHVTRYFYDAPVRGVVQSHRLTPADFDGQKVIDWVVIVPGGQRGGSFRDGAGDRICAWTVLGPVAELAITVTGTVDTEDMAGVLRGHREVVQPDAYLRATLPTRADVQLQALAMGVAGKEPLALAHDLSAAISAAIAYRPGVTTAHTTAAEALALGEGVCQDHAHALISVARLRGLPARYVSGYLFADAEGVPHEAAHAWAEIHITGIGWIGFDAANSCCPDVRYIRLGSGMDARDAAPIRGTSRGKALESLSVEVAVQSTQQ